MDTPDATPSRDDDVVVPTYLRKILRKAAERKLRDEREQPYSAEVRDAVIETMQCIDALADERPDFVERRVSLADALALIPAAIAWQASQIVTPDTRQTLGLNQRLLLDIQELLEFRERLGGVLAEADVQVDAVEVPR